jgi:hypothetical protein
MSRQSPSSFVTPLVEDLKKQSTSVALTGQNREQLTRVAVGLAGRLDPAFQWFDIRDRHLEAPRWQADLASGSPSGQAQLIDVREMRLDDAAGNVATSMIGRDGHPDTSFLTLADLLRLPAELQEAAARPNPNGRARVVLITNGERARAAFGGEEGSLRPYLEAMNHSGVTVILTACSRPRENRHDWDLVLLVRPESAEPPAPPAVECMATRSAGMFSSIPLGACYAPSALAPIVSRPPAPA